MTTPRHRRRARLALGAAVAAVALLAAACGGGSRRAATHRPPGPATTSTTAAPTTTTAPPVAPLTGLPQPNAAQLAAPAVVVKIDNVDAARPQTGIEQADVVYEEMVEGGLTRLAAVFQSAYPDPVGPVRSGRTTDIAIVDDLNHPVFAYSGTNNIFYPQLRSQPITDVDGDNHPSAFFRQSLAPAPHNLYSNVTTLAGLSTTHAPPPALFAYRAAGTPFAAAGVTPAASITVRFPAASAVWTYDATSKLWLRTQNGTPDLARSGTQVSAANVVVQFIPYTTDGYASGEGLPPTPIPKGQLLGSGRVWVLSAGGLVGGTWSRPGLLDTTTYLDGSGAPIRLAPGRTWVELLPEGSTPTVAP